MTTPPAEAPDTIPTAIIEPSARRAGPARLLPWLVPIAAVILTIVLITQALASRGPSLTLAFQNGHGIRENDPIVHRGVQVGRVRSIDFAPTGQVRIRIELTSAAAFLAKSGRFWIVRPELSLSRVAGLETIVGPRYIEADFPSGNTGPISLETPPPDSGAEGLRILIRAPRAGSLAAGSPVSYRELRVGEIISVSLAPDARSVEIAVRINPEHARLVRRNSVFWNVSGIGLDLGFVGGLKLKAESLQTILSGGLAFATPDRPPPPADPVPQGHEFPLSEYDEAYLRWSPDLGDPKPQN